MADAFATVGFMLLVAAGVFAQGLSTVGFISGLISPAQSFGSGAIIAMIALVIITMLAAMTTGSGNAPFYAFVELIPRLCTADGYQPGVPGDPDVTGVQPRPYQCHRFPVWWWRLPVWRNFTV